MTCCFAGLEADSDDEEGDEATSNGVQEGINLTSCDCHERDDRCKRVCTMMPCLRRQLDETWGATLASNTVEFVSSAIFLAVN